MFQPVTLSKLIVLKLHYKYNIKMDLFKIWNINEYSIKYGVIINCLIPAVCLFLSLKKRDMIEIKSTKSLSKTCFGKWWENWDEVGKLIDIMTRLISSFFLTFCVLQRKVFSLASLHHCQILHSTQYLILLYSPPCNDNANHSCKSYHIYAYLLLSLSLFTQCSTWYFSFHHYAIISLLKSITVIIIYISQIQIWHANVS